MEERRHSDSDVNVIYALKSNRSKVVFDTDIVDGHPIAENENAPAQGWDPIAVVHNAGLQWLGPDGMGCPNANGQLHDAATIMRGEAGDGITVVAIRHETHPAQTETKLGVRTAKTMDDATQRNDSSHLSQLQSAVDPKNHGANTYLRLVQDSGERKQPQAPGQTQSGYEHGQKRPNTARRLTGTLLVALLVTLLVVSAFIATIFSTEATFGQRCEAKGFKWNSAPFHACINTLTTGRNR